VSRYLQRRYQNCKYIVGGGLFVDLSVFYYNSELEFLNSIIDVAGSVYIETHSAFRFASKPPALANLTTIGGQMLQPNEFSLQLVYYGTLRNGFGLNRLRGMYPVHCFTVLLYVAIVLLVNEHIYQANLYLYQS